MPPVSSRITRTLKPPRDDLFLERGGAGQGREDDGRAQVGVEAEDLAQRQQGAALGLLVRRQGLPLRAADRAEQDGVGRLADIDGGLRQGLPFVVDPGAADIGLGALEGHFVAILYRVQHPQRLGHHLRADTVPGQNRHLETFRHRILTLFQVR